VSGERALAADGLGELLRRHRLASGLSQEELAERSGLSVGTISNMERGRSIRPYRRSVRSLADALALTGLHRDQLLHASRLTTGPGRTPGPEPPGEVAAAAVPAPLPAPGVRYSLPPDTAAFTGRDGELHRITAALPDARDSAAAGVVPVRAVHGMPGVGKTALAVHAAHLLASRFPDRQLFVDLGGHTPGRDAVRPDDALAELLVAVGVDPRHLPDGLAGRAALWRDKMAGQKALLVLDNAASSAQAVPLLPGSAGCLVLVTSRRHLADLPGAVVPVLVEVLPPEQAQEMFVRLAPEAGAAPAAVAELAEMAGYLPLAISLLARVYARHPVWTLADLAAETRARLLTLTAEHVSVTAAFEVSWQHLEPDRRRFLSCLGLHPGPSTDAYGAAALAAAGLEEAARLLDGLHAEGLLTETGYRRYGMHDLIRRYAADRAVETMTQQERDSAVARLLDYCQHTAGRAEALLARESRDMAAAGPAVPPWPVPDLADAGQALAWVRGERSMLLACLNYVTATGQQARLVALTAGIAELLHQDGPWAEALTRHAVAARAARDLGDRRGQANALLQLARTRQVTCDYPGAAEILAQALGIFGELGDRAGQASALRILGFVRLLTSDYPAATEALTEALGILRDLGDRPGQANVLGNLIDARILTEDYAGEADAAAEALAIFTDLGDRLGQARVLVRLKEAKMRAGDYAGTAEILAEALATFADLGDWAGQATVHRALGNLWLDTGDYLAATQSMASALAIYRGFGDRLGQANTLFDLGSVRLRTGDYTGATEVLAEALGTYRDLGQRLGQANALLRLGEVQTRVGDYADAARTLARTMAIYRAIGSRLGEALALTRLGRLQRLTGDYLAAAQILTRALAVSRDVGYRNDVAETLNEAGALHLARGDLGRATDCHQEALDLARQFAMASEEAHALAGLGRCALAAGDRAGASARLRQAHAIFQRSGAAEAAQVAADLDALAPAGT
jgi:tetratricopeptide (TPR) repeat protein/DNA-binding XRE family transcriptional regulator